MRNKNKVIRPPALPTSEDELELSDEDIDFWQKNRPFTNFISNLDTKLINKYVTRVADQDEDEIEKSYEEGIRKKNKKSGPSESKENELQVDPVYSLPIKTLDGKLKYQTGKKAKSEENSDSDNEDRDKGKSVIKLTKAERRQKEKKIKKEAKKQRKAEEQEKKEERESDSPKAGKLQSEVLKEVQEDLTAEEVFTRKKIKLAELGLTLIEDPEANIRSLRELLQICEDGDPNIVRLGLMSLLAVFKDIIPSYRIRPLTEKELAMQVSEAVRKTRYYEYTLLRSYKAYLQRLVSLERNPSYNQVAVRCICTLLDSAPHFNFRESLLAGMVKNLSSSDDTVRKLCCEAIRSLFRNEGKHGSEATVEAVRLIADQVKLHDCQLHPDSITVFLSLRFDEDLGKSARKMEEKKKFKKIKKKWKKPEGGTEKLSVSDKKKMKQELIAKTRQEVYADFKAVSLVPDSNERQRMQTETLSAVFETYFRILKHSMDVSGSRSHPLLAPSLDGLAKFSHLIDLDFMGDLMTCLKKLAGYGAHASGGGIRSNADVSGRSSSSTSDLSVTERLKCCVVAFKVMRSNLDALNVDLQDFFVQLYNLLLEYRPGRDSGEVLAEAFKTMLWEGKQHDMQRIAAFIKRLATFSLSFGSAEAMAALVTIKQLLQKNNKCRNLLENDAGGGSLSGLVVKYQPEATDPYLSGALASVLWELSLLSKHYNPNISSIASNILSMANLKPTQNNLNFAISSSSPLQIYSDLTIEKELSKSIENKPPPSLNRKRKRDRGVEFFTLDPEKVENEDEVRERLEEHFRVISEIEENERLKGELNRTLNSIGLYEEFKREKKKKKKKVDKSASLKGDKRKGGRI